MLFVTITDSIYFITVWRFVLAFQVVQTTTTQSASLHRLNLSVCYEQQGKTTNTNRTYQSFSSSFQGTGMEKCSLMVNPCLPYKPPNKPATGK